MCAYYFDYIIIFYFYYIEYQCKHVIDKIITCLKYNIINIHNIIYMTIVYYKYLPILYAFKNSICYLLRSGNTNQHIIKTLYKYKKKSEIIIIGQL